MTLSFLSSSSCASMLPNTSPMIERYKSNNFPCIRGTKIDGWRRYSLMSLKAFWHSSFHVWGSIFLRSLKMGSQVEVSLAMNWQIYCSQPRNPLISFSFLGGDISKSWMDLLLSLYHLLGNLATSTLILQRYTFGGSTLTYTPWFFQITSLS